MVMSQTEVSVEWLFNEIKTYFKFVSLKSKVRIGRSSHRRCSVRKGVLRNFGKFTGKHLCQSLSFNKVAGLACFWIGLSAAGNIYCVCAFL